MLSCSFLAYGWVICPQLWIYQQDILSCSFLLWFIRVAYGWVTCPQSRIYPQPRLKTCLFFSFVIRHSCIYMCGLAADILIRMMTISLMEMMMNWAAASSLLKWVRCNFPDLSPSSTDTDLWLGPINNKLQARDFKIGIEIQMTFGPWSITRSKQGTLKLAKKYRWHLGFDQ